MLYYLLSYPNQRCRPPIKAVSQVLCLERLQSQTSFLRFETKLSQMLFTVASVQFSHSVWLFTTPWIAACQASLSNTNSQSLLKLMPIELVMPSSHLILCCPLLLLPSLPASGSFPVNQLFAWGDQRIGDSVSASVLPMNTQDWSPCSPRYFQESSPTP